MKENLKKNDSVQTHTNWTHCMSELTQLPAEEKQTGKEGCWAVTFGLFKVVS